jgi:hypothetical protein
MSDGDMVPTRRQYRRQIADTAFRQNAGDGPHGEHTHARERLASSPWRADFDSLLQALPPRAKKRLTRKCDELYAAAVKNPRQAILTAGQLVAAEACKLARDDPQAADALRVAAAKQFLGAAIQVALWRPARAPKSRRDGDAA